MLSHTSSQDKTTDVRKEATELHQKLINKLPQGKKTDITIEQLMQAIIHAPVIIEALNNPQENPLKTMIIESQYSLNSLILLYTMNPAAIETFKTYNSLQDSVKPEELIHVSAEKIEAFRQLKSIEVIRQLVNQQLQGISIQELSSKTSLTSDDTTKTTPAIELTTPNAKQNASPIVKKHYKIMDETASFSCQSTTSSTRSLNKLRSSGRNTQSFHQESLTISATIQLQENQALFICGENPLLGAWKQAICMKYVDNNKWIASFLHSAWGSIFTFFIGDKNTNKNISVTDLKWQLSKEHQVVPKHFELTINHFMQLNKVSRNMKI